ncbi:MAG: HAMP domain-containing protein [Elusimicrobia bacterium]|nr:HAMP domain-containing protein [Elusimicrobiota bacterium]
MKTAAPQRKKILVNKKFQFKYTLMIIGMLILMVILVEWDIYYTAKTIYQRVAFVEGLKQDITFFHILIGAKFFIFMVFIAFISIYFSHRIAGPIYRLEKTLLNIISEGDLTKTFCLREKDELKELETAFNTMISNLRLKLLADEEFREKTRVQINEILKIIRERKMTIEKDRTLVINKIEELSNASKISPITFKL